MTQTATTQTTMTQTHGASVLELHRYPVKSMMGEMLDHVEITDKGFKGDRVFAVRDEVRGGIRGGKKIPQLMTLRATTEEAVRPCARITAPSGETLLSTAPDISQWLSSELQHSVTLWPLLPPEQLDHYRRGAPDNEDFEQELRGLFGRLPDEPLPDLALFAEVIDFESPPGLTSTRFPCTFYRNNHWIVSPHTTLSNALTLVAFDLIFSLIFPASITPIQKQRWQVNS